MADTKLLGTLQLNKGNVISVINEVNDAQQRLGKGIDLDLSHLLNAKVNSQLESLKKQIQEVANARSVASKSTTDAEKKALDDFNKMQLASQEMKTANARKHFQEQQKVQQWYDKDSAKRLKDQMDLEAKITKDGIEKRGKEEEKVSKKTQDIQKKLATTAISLLGAASLKTLKDQWSAAIDYATTYYDKLNEIRVVTGKTEAEASKIGQKMRDLAKEMKVTSTEQSEAAVTFYRQGLNDAEVQDRLKWVTEYAKVANIQFDEAAQLMTAAINTMGDSIETEGFTNVVEHIADVFLYLGDNAATSGEEIGKAMQKASASATEFGLSFEWLGTYIATVSEQTRQAPESIGNAFNTMLARMHQIKASGFNDEDTTKLNDVAKALASIDVELLDSEGQWRDMDKIYSDVAEKWGELDAKTKGYLATTMAGTRQQNVFYALMNDLSKGIEGGSRAWYLYTGAMNAAETATKKFATWQESIKASQSNMTNSLEQLYSILQPTLIKGFYDVITVLVNGLNNLGGVIPVVLSALAGLTAGFLSFKVALTATAVAAHPLLAVLIAAGAALASLGVFGGIGALFGDVETSAEKYEKASRQYEEAGKKIEEYKKAQSDLNTLFDKQQKGMELSSDETATYNSTLDKLKTLSPEAAAAVEGLTGKFDTQKESLSQLNDILNQTIEAEEREMRNAAKRRYQNYSLPEELKSAEVKASPEEILEFLRKYGYDGKSTESFNSTVSKVTSTDKGVLYGIDNNTDRIIDSLMAYQQAAEKAIGAIKGEAPEDTWSRIYAQMFSFLESDYLEGEKYQQKLTQEMEGLIDDAIGSVKISPSSAIVLREAVRKAIIGEDGVLTGEDLGDQVGAVINSVVSAWEQQGEKMFSNAERITGIIREVFGEDVSDEISSQLEQIANNDFLAERFISIYEQLIQSGLSKLDIKKIFEQSGFYADARGAIGAALLKVFPEINDTFLFKSFGVPNLQIQAKLFQVFTSGAKETREATKDLLNSSKSWDEFVKNIDDSTSDIEEDNEAIDDRTQSIKKLKDGYSEQNKIDELQGTLRKGEPIKMSDLLDFEDSHPELALLINDVVALEAKLREIKEEEKEAIKNLVLDSELIFSKSSLAENEDYKKNGVVTYRQAQEWENNNRGILPWKRAGNINTLALEINAYVDALIHASEKTQGLSEDFDNFLNKVQNVGKAKEALQVFKDTFSGKDIDTDKLSSAGETQNKIFDGKNIDPKSETFIEDVTAAIIELETDAESAGGAFGVLGQMIVAAMKQGKEAVEQMKYALNNDVINALIQNGSYENIGTFIEKQFGNGNANALTQSRAIQADGTYKSVAPQYYDNGENALQVVTPVLPNGQELTDAQLREYVSQLFASGEPIEMDKEENGGRGIVLFSQDGITNMEEAGEAAQQWAENLTRLWEAYNGAASMADFAKQAADSIKNAKAETEGYKNQINELSNALKKGGVKEATKQWDALGKEIQTAITNKYPRLIIALNNARQIEEQFNKGLINEEEYLERSTKASKELNKEMERATRLNSAKYFKDSAQALYDIGNGTKTVEETLKSFRDAEEKATEAQLEFTEASQKMADGTELAADDVKKIAEVLDMTPEDVIKNWDTVGKMMDTVKGEIANLRAALQEQIIYSIVGTSDADFSNIMSGLTVVQDQANETVQALLATGQFELVEEELKANVRYPVFENGNIVMRNFEGGGTAAFIKPKGEGVLKTTTEKSSSGGGGGGGGNKNKESEVTNLLDGMKEVIDLQDHLTDIYAAQAGYYKETGELQAVIAYTEKQRDAVAKQNETLEENIATLDEWITKKKAEMESLKEGSDEYKTAKDELEKLEDRHREYEKLLISNKTQVMSLTKSIKEQNNAIRDMEIKVYDEVLKAIEDREKKREDRLKGTLNVQKATVEVIKQQVAAEKQLLSAVVAVENALISALKANESRQKQLLSSRVSMEDKVLSVIQNRYSEQQKAMQEANEAQKKALNDQIDALEKQKDLLDEQLRLRKELAEEQDKQVKLHELEEQYARISADPTRLKEAMKIKEQIDELRDEIGWDIAEKEVENQKKAIDNQIESLRDQIDNLDAYMSSMDNFFSDITRMVREMEEVMAKPGNDLIEWLKSNDKEYLESSSAKKEQTEQEWQDMLDAMQGHVKDYRETVKGMLTWTDDELIEFLANSDEEYATATENRKAQIVDEWKNMLQEMRGETETYTEEMQAWIAKGFDGWLEEMKNHSTDYATATEEGRTQMLNEWTQLWKDMTGEVENHEDEIMKIISGGMDSIIAFLEENSDDYVNAGKLAATAYIDGWKEELENLQKALNPFNENEEGIDGGGWGFVLEDMTNKMSEYVGSTEESTNSIQNSWEEAFTKIEAHAKNSETEVEKTLKEGQVHIIQTMNNYVPIFNQTANEQKTAFVTPWIEGLNQLAAHALSTMNSIIAAANGAATAIASVMAALGQSGEAKTALGDISLTINTGADIVADTLPHFATGGVADFTGPAWVDGPERILSPRQTELFEILVQSLDTMSRIDTPMIPEIGNVGGGQGNPITVGDIVVQVEELASDTDYEDMAEKVFDSIMERINRGSAVGGIRFSR